MDADTHEETLSLLRKTNCATLTTILAKHGIQRCYMYGVKPLQGKPYRFVAPAYTVRTIAAREDKTKLDKEADKRDPRANVQRQSVEGCPPGHAMVIDCRGNPSGAAGGAILYERMQRRGVAAVITDGSCRDGFEIAELGIPVFVKEAVPPPSFVAHRFLDMQVPISVAEVAVYPGDYIFGDPDGIVVVPQEIALDVARAAAEYERMEQYILTRVRTNVPIFGVYPLHGDELEGWEKVRCQKTR